jgi:hypothetical protein
MYFLGGDKAGQDKWRSICNQAVILYELTFVRLVNVNYLFYGVVLLAHSLASMYRVQYV